MFEVSDRERPQRLKGLHHYPTACCVYIVRILEQTTLRPTLTGLLTEIPVNIYNFSEKMTDISTQLRMYFNSYENIYLNSLLLAFQIGKEPTETRK